MQAGSTSGSEAKSSSATPSASPPAAVPKLPAEEDSGLHDIRSLAQTTKDRISSKRITLSPTKSVSEEELIASASGSWKSLALPQPASMVSLPALSELPPAAVIEKSKPMFAATIAQQPPAKSSSRRMMAIVGLGIAAAAGVTLFVTMSSKDAAPTAAPTSEVATAATPAPAPAPAPVAPAGAPVVQHIEEAPAAGSAAAVVAAAPPPVETPPEAAPAKSIATKSRAKTPAAHAAAKPTVIATKDQPPAPAAESKKSDTGVAGKSDATGKAVANGQESLDQLIKEAGAEDKPKAGPVLDKKELSANDFKSGMSAIQGKAQACFKGTQGMAQVKLVIVPSGKVTRVTVTGKFAGKPEAECVTSAVKSATFPPWDGGSQTMGYSFLLSE
ncbi:MAG TPA: hypothetical protein VGG28_10685 [Kofleriaceae bacterium]